MIFIHKSLVPIAPWEVEAFLTVLTVEFILHPYCNHSHQPRLKLTIYWHDQNRRVQSTPTPIPSLRTLPNMGATPSKEQYFGYSAPIPSPGYNGRPPQPGSTGMFPPSFPLFYKSSPETLITIGPNDNHSDFVFILSSGFSGKMKLCGADRNQSPICVAKSSNFTGDKMEIRFNNGQTEQLRSSDMLKFKWDLGVGPYGQLEKFIWSQASSSERSALGQCSKGYKLVRERDGAVLAMVAQGHLNTADGFCRFAFTQHGASGEFGPHWANMAVITFAKMWHIMTIKKIAGAVG